MLGARVAGHPNRAPALIDGGDVLISTRASGALGNAASK